MQSKSPEFKRFSSSFDIFLQILTFEIQFLKIGLNFSICHSSQKAIKM